MLKSIALKNFQKHAKRIIRFGPTVTMIVGDSDEGKSTIIRALRWVCLNIFDGPADSFIRWGSSFAKVKLRVDGRTIIRSKGIRNHYELDGKDFKAFGTKVPDEIAELLKISPENFQNQLDAHFWFSQSAPQVGRELNQIVNLGDIDESLASLAAMTRQAKAAVEICHERLHLSLDARKQAEWIIAVDRRLIDLESQKTRISVKASIAGVLRGLLSKASKASKKRREASETADRSSRVALTSRRACKAAERAKQLRRLLKSLKTAVRFARVKLRPLPDPKIIEQLAVRRERLVTTINKILEQERELCKATSTTKSTADKLKSLKGKPCPVCGAPINP